MPNGFQGSREKWQELERPLLEIDGLLQTYARSHGMRLTINYHGWPNRSLSWKRGSLHRKMGVHLQDEDELSFVFAVVAWQDRGGERFLRQEAVTTAIQPEDLKASISGLLGQGYELLESWTEEDLVYAGKVEQI